MRTNLLVRSLFALIVGAASCATALAGAFDNEILAYEQQDALFPPPQGAIVVTGSSTIGRWNTIRNDLAPLEIIPRGFGGSTADDLDYYLERIVLAYAPRAVVIYEGDNDIAQGWTPQYVASRIAGIAGRISAQYPNARVYIISIKPSPSRWGVWPQMQQANQLLADFCATDPRYRYIDAASALLGSDGLPRPEYYASDTLHLSTAGYTAWTGAVRPVLIAGEQSSIVVPGLQGQDIGAVAAAGSSSVSGGAFTVRGSGSDVWDAADEFHYVWRSLNGDGQITARVASQTNTASWAKTGVMLREQLTTDSRYAFMFVTPGAGSFLQYRTVTGGSAGPGSGAAPGIAAPYWVRLVRQGNVVTGYNSPNGITWTQRGSVTFSSLPSTLYIGLAVSSHNDGVLGTAVFDNVHIPGATQTPPPPPPPTDVTPPTVPTGLQATAVGTNQINLSWNASSDSGTGVAGYRVFRNGVPAGTSTTTTYVDSGLSANTLYTYTVSAYDAASPANESGQSSAANATTLASSTSGYQSQDIGAVAAVGSSSESGGIFTVRGSGYDIWGTSDEFHYAWRSLNGDGQITARVASQTNTASWAKAGVMLREQLTADSRYAFMFVTPGAGSFLQYRTVTGGSAGPGSGTAPGIAAPYWVRLVRQGNVVTGYNSPDGVTWTLRGSVTFSTLPSTLYIGLAVSSHNDGVLGTAVFDNVLVSGSSPPPPPPPPPPTDVTPPTVPTGLQATAVGTSQINLSWNASSDSGTGVAGYRVFRNGVPAGTSTTTTYADTALIANTLYTYTVSAYDAASPANESGQSGVASATTQANPASAYQSQDIGAVGVAGSSSESGGVFTVRGSGFDVAGTSDEFHYVWQSLTGDGQLTVRVASQTKTANEAKAGVMLREQLTATSRHAFMFVTPASGSFLQYRTVTGGSTAPSLVRKPGIKAPYWLRLVRQGNVVTGYNSRDGITWAQRGSVTFSSLPSTVYIGLAVSSANDGVLGTAVFDNVARSP